MQSRIFNIDPCFFNPHALEIIEIMKAACRYHNAHQPSAMLHKKRYKPCVRARQWGYIFGNLRGVSTNRMASMFGFDHTSVRYSIHSFPDRIFRPEYADELNAFNQLMIERNHEDLVLEV